MTLPLESKLLTALGNGAGCVLSPVDVMEVCRWLDRIRNKAVVVDDLAGLPSYSNVRAVRGSTEVKERA
jgi:hypothetical protein